MPHHSKKLGHCLKCQKVVLTNPVRRSFSQLRAQNYPSIDLNEKAIQILVLGGSLEQKVFNDVVPRAIAEMPENLRRRFVIVQQCRSEDIDRVHKTYKEAGVKQNLETFFENVSEQMAAAHIVISRAGASTIAELAEVGRPAILVPYPHAVDDHQTANAREVDDRRAGWHIPQEDFTSEYLTKHLERFVALPDKLLSAAEIAKSCGGRNSANAVADQVDLISLDRPNGGASANAKTVPGSAMTALPLRISTIHFVGIGGIGMGRIAEILHNLKYSVQGSDIADSANVMRLRNLGINISVGHSAKNIGDAEVVVMSSAVEHDNRDIRGALASFPLSTCGNACGNYAPKMGGRGCRHSRKKPLQPLSWRQS